MARSALVAVPECSSYVLESLRRSPNVVSLVGPTHELILPIV